MIADKTPVVTARLRKLHISLAGQGPTEETGRMLKALADVCDPVRNHARMWDAVTSPYLRKQTVIDAIDAAVAYTK